MCVFSVCFCVWCPSSMGMIVYEEGYQTPNFNGVVMRILTFPVVVMQVFVRDHRWKRTVDLWEL
jgi:hypothetical protein